MTEDIDEKYSDPPEAGSVPARSSVFALDSGSPESSVALLWSGSIETRTFSVGDSSSRLLSDLDELLEAAGGRLEELDGLVALQGPGSFTGLRVGLATILGLHQALGLPATAVTTFEALAWQARRRRGPSATPIVAAVDALRGERFAQVFDGESLERMGAPEIRSDASLAAAQETCIIGFGLEPLRAATRAAPTARLIDAEPLAVDLVAYARDSRCVWEPARLTEPLYLRPPAAKVKARAIPCE